jgi:outer membrane protein OmpA-like peptidoglycan-associated protein
MMQRVITFIIALAALSGCSRELAMLRVNPVSPDYSVTDAQYQHDCGDSVHVMRSDSEFVICESCGKSAQLERVLRPVTIVIRATSPSSVAAVSASPGRPVGPAPGTFPRSSELLSALVSTASPSVIAEPASSPTDSTIVKSSTTTTAIPTELIEPVIVHFSSGSTTVNSEEKRKFQYALSGMTGESFEVVGFTDDSGGQQLNDRIAIARAREVARVLHEAGFGTSAVRGRGKCCYVSSDQAMNRRVEVRKSSKDDMHNL